VLGDTAAGEVLAMKRVGRLSTRNNSVNSSSNGSTVAAEVTLLFQPPEALGATEMTLYAVADSALRLDAELVLPVQVVKAQPKVVDSSDSKHLLPLKKPGNGNSSGNSGNSSAAADFWGPAPAASNTTQQSGKQL
jgi:hypothetical protein